ncbi:trypsin-like peptidase domain-containing protein [Corynebacterium meridianum]|uniref:Trypsin-like peptidase domain-containing protein n=1 Tax=Corynebacterium meridianum TaxID=2765363 RepID=A0A934HX34_9CORY|nr:trypsin-like peptidase domain-containing protein [Corynebacterium meridianum]MBI8988543.1 trypsin-like peptidase domain-containing protein [Corynebacterium meridianum]MCK7677993.1 trypsin-like peptidase domain-containing protein [Corynebacterium meridianum]
MNDDSFDRSQAPGGSTDNPYGITGSGAPGTGDVSAPWDVGRGASGETTSSHPRQPGGGQTPPPQGGAPTQSMTPVLPQPQRHRSTRKQGLGVIPVTALMLTTAILTGTITGVVVSRDGQGPVPPAKQVNALNEPAAHRTSLPAAGSVEDVAASVLPAVVSIEVTGPTKAGEGSGSIISADGMILTNNHVVTGVGEPAEIRVNLNDDRSYLADIVATDAQTDIAVIKLRDAKDLPVMTFGDSNDLTVGEQVVAIGSPLGLSATVTTGIVSALNRPVRAGGDRGESSLIDAIQTDAAINPGNSGGPLVNMEGQLIGMNSVIASTASGEAGSIGLGFAIPVNQARRIAQQLIDTGEVTHPLLGVLLAQKSRYRGGLVESLTPGGPAEKAGIRPGELVLKVNDRVIDSNDALIAAIRSHEFGETVTLKVADPETRTSRDVEVTLTDS